MQTNRCTSAAKEEDEEGRGEDGEGVKLWFVVEAAGRIDSDASFQKNRRRRRRDAKKIFFHSGKEEGLCFD